MDELRVECPFCGVINMLVVQDVHVGMGISCSSCGEHVGKVRDFIRRERVDAPPLTSPDSARERDH